jgi:diguanylate cyclase (GGDEF)-like protein
VLARWVDDRLVSELEAVTKLEITLSPASLGSAAGLSPEEQLIESVDSNTLTATTVLADVGGAPAITAQLTMPRDIFAEGQRTSGYLIAALLLIGLVFTLLIIAMLEFTVLQPVAHLSRFVSSVGIRLDSRAPATGRDEIGHLGRSINGMLDSIERYSAELTQTNAELHGERMRIEELNRSLEARVSERTAELEMANAELRDRNRQLITATRQASTDGLTGLKNHRAFQEDIRLAVERARPGAELAVLMADIDAFKDINDVHGHPAGDLILSRVGDIFREVLGEQAAFRYGGDEFAMMTWVSSLSEAEAFAEDIRLRIEASFSDPALTISVGVAPYSQASSPEELVYHADAAMYAAKAAGKNRVRIWTRAGAALPATDTVTR